VPSTRPTSPTPDLLTRLLREVSRSFHLTIRVLPSTVRAPIGLAYLLARTTDTIADTGLLSPEDRLGALNDLRTRILGLSQDPLDFTRFIPGQGSPAERRLLERTEETLRLLEASPAANRTLIREVLAVILSGQELDLRRFGHAGPNEPRSLRTEPELDDYTYRVAGCVGDFWTRICLAHFPVPPDLDRPALLAHGVRFGKGLQLVNILRDLPADLRLGRCYLPLDQLQSTGLQPRDLLDPASEPLLRPLYNRWLDTAHAHLTAGWTYTNTLPRNWVRIRLACAWPALIGARTLHRLRTAPILDASRRVKVPRREVRSILVGTILRLPSRAAWERQFDAATRT
jgi:farnesyl-diphosphate farnesyltransferase